MRFTGIAVAIIVGLVAAPNAQLPQPQAADIARQLQAELEAANVPAAAIAVVSGDETVARGFGDANLESGAQADGQTLMQVGSLSKLMTALALTSVLDSRRIPASSAIDTHLDGLSPRAAKTSFHQLLSQTSGLRDRPGNEGTADEKALLEAARGLTDSDFLLPGGTVFSYSNLGYALAGAALERIARKPFADAMQEVLFTPLGMAKTTFRPAEAMARAHAVGHRLEKGIPLVVRPANDTQIWPAGYAWSSAADMVKLVAALVHGGRVYARPTIAGAALTAVTTPHTPMPNVFVGGHYGYGLMISRDRGALVYEHGGTMPGYSALLRIIPGRRLGVAILTNLENAPLRRIVPQLMGKALNLPDTAPPARDERPVTAEEMKPFIGTYVNRGSAEIAVENGAVVLKLDDGPAMAVSRIDATRFLARPKPEIAGPEFVLVPAKGEAPAYLHVALWAYVKQ